MAVHKVIRSNPPAQPQPQRPNHQFKAEIFEILRHLNRGYGVALAAFDKLEIKDRSQTKSRPQAGNDIHIFTAACLGEFRNRTEALQAEANRDLARLIAAHENQEVESLSGSVNKARPRS
jgi:hypothetical protein